MAPRHEKDGLSVDEPHEAYKFDPSLSMQQRIDWFLDRFGNDAAYQGKWETETMQNTKCIAASLERGTIVYEVDIIDSFCTVTGHLHGGAASTILDQLTSIVLHMYAKPGFIERGTVTRTLTVTCLRPVPAGSRLRVETELVSIGKTMGNVKGVIKTMEGKICFVCIHDKAILPSAPKL